MFFKSINGGATWTNLTTPLIQPYDFYTVSHQGGTNGGVYITSNSGAKVFYRNNTMLDWADFSKKLPKEYRPVSTKPFYKKGKLRTAGNRGIWEVDFYESSLPLAQPTVDKLVSQCPRDTFYFNDFSVLDHSAATWTWSFPAATYVSSTNVRNPKVLYNNLGNYTATLTVQQGTMSSTNSVDISVQNSICEADSLPGFAAKVDGNGTGQYVGVPPLGINTNELTITAWIKIDGIQPDYSCIFMHDGPSAGFNFRPGNNHLGFHWDTGPWWWDSGLEVPDGEWAHVAMVVSPTEVRLYLNGESSANTFTVPAMDFTQFANRLGNYKGWGSRYMKGQIDEVAIYDKSLTENEIRDLRHLTKVPSNSPNLIAYYQFNETKGVAYDKVGSNHATLNGASRVVSTGPFGGGESYRMNITSGGLKDFVGTDVKVNFSSTSGTTYPDGDVVVSKLLVSPDQDANANPVSSKYWVINNYGSNKIFTTLDDITFGGLPPFANVTSSDFHYYRRGENADGNTWNSQLDVCDLYTVNGSNSTMLFNQNNGITQFGQFSLNSSKLVHPIDVTEYVSPEGNLKVFPIPANDLLYLNYDNTKGENVSTIQLLTVSGQLVLSTNQEIREGKNTVMLDISKLSAGLYSLKFVFDEVSYNRKVVISD